MLPGVVVAVVVAGMEGSTVSIATVSLDAGVETILSDEEGGWLIVRISDLVSCVDTVDERATETLGDEQLCCDENGWLGIRRSDRCTCTGAVDTGVIETLGDEEVRETNDVWEPR